jgi:predicted MFS family arabinose efflux permease
MIIFALGLFLTQYVFYLASSRGVKEKLSNGFHFKLKSWRPVIKFSVLTLFGNIAGGMLFALFPYYVNQKFGIASAGLGTLFFASNLAMAMSKGLAASVAKKLGNMKSIVLGVALSGLFFFLMPLSPSFSLLGVLYVLRSGTRFMSDPILTSLFMKSVSKDEQSTANSIRMIAMNGGGVLSPWLGGTLMENVSLDSPAYLGAGLTMILSVLYPLLLRKEISETNIALDDNQSSIR